VAYIQNRLPPPNKISSFTLENYSGGLNNISDQLEVNESPDLLNMVFSDETLMERRKGIEYYDADEVATSTAIVFQDEYKPYNEANIFIKATVSKIYFGTTEFTIAGKPSGVNHKGKYFFTDGAKIYVYGKFPQEDASPTVDVIGTPNVGYVVMEVVSPTSSYTPVASPATQGKTVIDYTHSKIQYQPCEIEVEDTCFGANVLPSKPKYVCSYNGRLVITGCDKDDDNIFLTSTISPYYFPVTMPVQIPPTSDKVMGIIEFDGAVIVARDNDLYTLRGLTNNPALGLEVFSLKRINSHTGIVCSGGMCLVNNYLFMLGSDGNIYALNSSKTSERVLSTILINKKIDLFKAPISLTVSDLALAESIFYKDEMYLAIKDKIIIYNYRNQAFTLFNNINARSFYDLGGTLLIGTLAGRTVKFSTTLYSDLGLPYQAYWKSKNFDMDEPNTIKFFRDFYITAHNYNTVKSDIDLHFEIDYVDVNKRSYVSSIISAWGRTKFGERFISRNINISSPVFLGRRGRNVSFTFSNGYFINATVATVADLVTCDRTDGTLIYVTEGNKYYLSLDLQWILVDADDLFQAMKVYSVSGEFELRSKR
jgi:hypothetical protein